MIKGIRKTFKDYFDFFTRVKEMRKKWKTKKKRERIFYEFWQIEKL